MPKKKIKINVEPIGKRIYLDMPTNGLDALIDAGIGIKSVCAGKGTCGKCRILVLDKSGDPPNSQEEKILSPDEIGRGIRLACQQAFDRDMNIYIPASSLSEKQKLQVGGKEKIVDIDPVCRKYFLQLKKATMDDLGSDLTRIKRALKKEYGIKVDTIDLRAMAQMPQAIRSNSWEVTATIRGKEIILIEGGDRTKNSYGLAIDLGTTKIAVLLVDLLTGRTIDSTGVMNPQISFGEDVMSRLNYAAASDENSARASKVVTDKINDAVIELCAENNLKKEEIIEMTVVGNTAMHHLFLGLPVKQLGLSPFIALTDEALNIKAREAGIRIASGAYIYLLPLIAGFVGSDHLAVVIASDIHNKKGNHLAIDIGTNTEIALKSGNKITSVSTASGPAFEGAHIKHGMRAAPGAIERVIIDPGTCVSSIQTINDKEAVGICGSGILDAVAELLKAGIIDKRGRFKQGSGSLCKDDKGQLQYVLASRAGGGTNSGTSEAASGKEGEENIGPACDDRDISISQKDIVEIQLAKGAMRTGIEVLLEDAGIGFKDIDRVVIAGAFGSYIDPKNVINIGMFPNISLKKISQVGNAAGVGAKMVLISKKQRAEAEKTARMIDYLELTVFPSFNDHFINSMQFPESGNII